MKKFVTNKGFTLIELIVVVVILGILGTIAFVSYQSYTIVSRDSKRTTDIKNIVEALELYKVGNSAFPTPENMNNISYSGSIAWTQGEFGKTSFPKKLRNSKIFKDPLTNLPYPYSVTNNNKEFEVAALLEGEYKNTNNLNNVTIGDDIVSAYVQGNYNGNFIRVAANNRDYLLGVPSILASNITSVDLVDILSNHKLVYDAYNNIPYINKDTDFNTDGGFNFNGNKLILFEGNFKDLYKDNIKRVTFLENLQTSYSGTLLENQGVLKKVMETEVDIINPSNTASNLAAHILNMTFKLNIAMLEVDDVIICAGGLKLENGTCIDDIPNIVTGLYSSIQNESSFNLSWNNAEGADSYGIYINNSYLGDTTGTGITLNGFTGNTDYDLKIISKNLYWEADPSSIYTVKTAPNPPTVSGIGSNNDSIGFTWSSMPGAIGYYIYKDNILLGPVPSNVTSLTLNTLVPYTSYNIDIQSIGAPTVGGLTAISNKSTTLAYLTSPAAPNDLSLVHASNDSMELSWSAVTGANSYGIYNGASFLGTTVNTTVVFYGLPSNLTANFRLISIVSGSEYSYQGTTLPVTTANTTLGPIVNLTLDSITSDGGEFSYDILASATKYASYTNHWFKGYSNDNTEVLWTLSGVPPSTTVDVSFNSVDSSNGFGIRQSQSFTTLP